MCLLDVKVSKYFHNFIHLVLLIEYGEGTEQRKRIERVFITLIVEVLYFCENSLYTHIVIHILYIPNDYLQTWRWTKKACWICLFKKRKCKKKLFSSHFGPELKFPLSVWSLWTCLLERRGTLKNILQKDLVNSAIPNTAITSIKYWPEQIVVVCIGGCWGLARKKRFHKSFI